MSSTQVNIKLDTKLKHQAEKIADQLGLSLSVVLRALLSEFVRRKQLNVSINDTSHDTPNDFTGTRLTKNLIADGWNKNIAKEFGEDYDQMLQDEINEKLIECQ
ncbi:MAG: type II toxin-antitoxin system RelB/DinJ family antitoxin [Candidatus Peribacteraceae bacterium]|nr:type II toxin-antitoxin system RelB/DinJ family antitoxin [Candidatus Peribacteraceae bacterium]